MAETSPASSTPPPTPVGINSLPEPAEDTIEMLLNDKRYTLVTKIECQKVPLNFGNTIAFQRLPGKTPAFFISHGDLSQPPGDITITRFGTWGFDMDDADAGMGWLTVPEGCPATIVTSTPQIFEMHSADCKIRDEGHAVNGTLSFKIRCLKM